MRVASLFGSAGCELRFAAAELIRTSVKSDEFPGVRQRLRDAQRRVQLRKLLVSVPDWIRGHLLLARAESGLLLIGGSAATPRLRRAVRVSCRAVEKLGANADMQLEAKAYGHLTDALEASSQRNSELALQACSDFMSAASRCQGIPAEMLAEVTERAAAAASSLGRKEQAIGFLAAIPATKLSAEGKLLLDHLQASN